MRKMLTYTVIGVVLMAGVLLTGITLASEPLPKGKPSGEADSLARKMMASLNEAAWSQTTTVS